MGIGGGVRERPREGVGELDRGALRECDRETSDVDHCLFVGSVRCGEARGYGSAQEKVWGSSIKEHCGSFQEQRVMEPTALILRSNLG